MAFCAYYVGVEMLEVEVAAPDVGVDSPGFMQPADPFRLCRELKVQLTGGESPPGPLAWVVVDALLLFVSFFFFFFWNQGLHARGHRDLAESYGLFSDCAEPAHQGWMS